MKILMVTPEVAPFVKVGGLADVVGSLPKALSQLGHDVRIICPKYGSLKPGADWIRHSDPLYVQMGTGTQYAGLWETQMPETEVRVYFLEFDRYFDRHEVYAGPWGDHADNGERFSFLSRAAIDLGDHLDWVPDIYHCHDWTTGLVPVYLNTRERKTRFGQAASVMTIHNLKFQGIFRPELLDYAGIPWDTFRVDGLECMGMVNMLKGGLYHSTKITTVSPTYAEEIQGAVRGEGLNHILKFRAADLIGVLNGIDMDAWDPATDPYLPETYTAESLDKRAASKASVQAEMGLEVVPDVPLFAAVARLYDQKGLDLLAEILDRVMKDMRVQVAILGSGDAGLEQAFAAAAARHPGKVAIHTGYNEGLAHRLYGGADVMLVPSRFEPCGLTQMYAMRYGSVPLVRSTGGLVDTVDQYEEGWGRGTGFRFELPTGEALYFTIGWACATYYDRPEEFRKLQLNGLKKTFDWEHSARKYEDIYKWAMDARRWVRAERSAS